MLPPKSLVSAENPGQSNRNSARAAEAAAAPTAGSLPAAATSACNVGPPLSGRLGGIVSRSRSSKRSSFFRIHARKATTAPAPASAAATSQASAALIATTAPGTAAFLTTIENAKLRESPKTNRASPPPPPTHRTRRPLLTSCAPPPAETETKTKTKTPAKEARAKQLPAEPAPETTRKAEEATATGIPFANPLAAGAGATNLAGAPAAPAHQIAVASLPSLAATAKTLFPSLSEAAVCARDPHPPLFPCSHSSSLPQQNSTPGDADDCPGAVAGGYLRTVGRNADRDYLQRIPPPTRQRLGQHAPRRMNMDQGKSGANRGASTLPSPPPTRATNTLASAATTPAPQRALLSSADFLSSPNSIVSATPPSAFSPALASPSPASTSPEADAPFDPIATTKKPADGDTRPLSIADSLPRKTPPSAAADPTAGRQGPSRAPAAGSLSDLSTTLNPIPESAPISLEDCQRSIPAPATPAQDAGTSPPVSGSEASITDDCNLSPSQRPQLVRPKASRPHRLGQLADTPSSLFTASPTATTPIRDPLKFSSLSRASSTRSVCSNAPLQHPTPELNARSGAYTGNIAALEASAERLSMTSSIEDAIRDAHAQLKRSDSQRSAALANSLRNVDGSSVPPVVTRQLSIVSLNSAARSGGYSPGGYVMSPNHSLSNSRLRSASTASKGGAPVVVGGVIPENGGPVEDLVPAMPPIMPRHGPGKSSVRSVRSSKLSLAEIAEVEPPVTLTQDALDQADRLPDFDDEDDAARPGVLRVANMGPDQTTPNANCWEKTTPTGPGETSDYGFGHPGASSSRQHQQPPNNRPRSTDTTNTVDPQNAFGDFDGVHCDPDHVDHVDFGALPPIDFGPQYGQPDEHYGQQQHPHDYLGQPQGHEHHYDQQHQEPPPAVPRPQGHQRHGSDRPKSYFDMNTGQEMLYYPAPVPAMLNLPPKLSKKPKAAQRNARQSRVLETMAQQQGRDSRIWLPETLDTGDFGGSFMGPEDSTRSPETSPLADVNASMAPPSDPDMSQEAGAHAHAPASHYPQELRRPAKLTDAEKRKSKMSLMPVDLPPQLRASAFFDLPSANATPIELKDGSAMSTLDSILDASASAPVSAFTDHTFAGKLGSEVYGAEKKKKKKTKKAANNASVSIKAPDSDKAGSMSTVREDNKTRASFLGLVGVGKRHSNDTAERSGLPGSRGKDSDPPSSSRRDDPAALDGGLLSPNSMMAPDDDEKASSDEEDDEEEEDEELYQGPPTTLLAELQIRKQRAKMRTRLPAQAYSHGMHTTLLELDAVAEVERKNRKGKRVNLAWEDPALAEDDEDEDEDVPLAFLQAVRANPNADISVAVAEVHRPLGLMERRDQEDNEPLSRRRDRLQGYAPEAPQGVYLNQVQQTRAQSQMGFMPSMSALNLSSNNLLNGHNRGISSASRLGLHQPPPLSPQHQGDGSHPQEPTEEEIEDEPLGDRMRRLKARDDKDNLLPLARPVSGAFSVEILSQLGDLNRDEEAEAAKNKGKSILTKNKEPPKTASSTGGSSKSAATPAKGGEVEETLGQRRRRLQAEREAREREMGILGGGNGSGLDLSLGAGLGLSGNSTMQHSRAPSKPMGMADILGAHPLERPMGTMDPREAERRRIEIEAERARLETEEKMRRMRAELAQIGGTAPGGAGQPQSTIRAVGGNMGMGMGANGQMGGNAAALANGYGNTRGLLHQQRPGLQHHMATGSISHTQMLQQRQLQQQFQQPGLNGGLVGSAGNFGPEAQQAQPGLMYGGSPAAGAYGAYGGAGPMPMPMQMPMQLPGQQTDMVERWRQGVMH